MGSVNIANGTGSVGHLRSEKVSKPHLPEEVK